MPVEDVDILQEESHLIHIAYSSLLKYHTVSIRTVSYDQMISYHNNQGFPRVTASVKGEIGLESHGVVAWINLIESIDVSGRPIHPYKV